jgi:hypothetical protein
MAIFLFFFKFQEKWFFFSVIFFGQTSPSKVFPLLVGQAKKCKNFSFHCKNCFSLCKKKIELYPVLGGAGCLKKSEESTGNFLWLPRTSHRHFKFNFQKNHVFSLVKKNPY